MNLEDSKSLAEQFSSPPWWYKTRGTIMLALGAILAMFSLFAPGVQMMGKDYSWLPMICFIILTIGGLRCFDAYLAQHSKGFFLNLQNGILDCVVALLVLFSLSGHPDRLSLLIAGYLISAGLLRVVVTFVVKLDNHFETRIGGLVSLILGLLIFAPVFTAAPWFLSLALSVEVGLRGWALIVLAKLKNSQGVAE